MLSLLREWASLLSSCDHHLLCAVERSGLPRDRSGGHPGWTAVVPIFCHVRHFRHPTWLYKLTVALSLVLYIKYFPPHLKYVTLDIEGNDLQPPERVKTNLKSDSWRLSVLLFWIVFIHLSVCHESKSLLLLTHIYETQGLLYFRYFHTSVVFALRPLRLYSARDTCLGNLPWCLIRRSRCIAICPADRTHLSSQARRRAQHTHDDDSDTRRHHYGDQHHDPVSFYTDLQVESIYLTSVQTRD